VSAPEKTRRQNPLVNHFFLTFATGKVGSTEYRFTEYQGQVIGMIGTDRCLVAVYDWICGLESVRKIVSVEQMADWRFYEDLEDLNAAYEQVFRHWSEAYVKAQMAHERAERVRVGGAR